MHSRKDSQRRPYHKNLYGGHFDTIFVRCREPWQPADKASILTILGAERIIAVASQAYFRLCYYIIITKRREEEILQPAIFFANLDVLNGFTARL
jgi:hypothetical protein